MLASALVLGSRGVLALAGEATATPAAAALVPGVADAFAAAVGVPALPPVTASSGLVARAQALAREAEAKSKALAEAVAAEEEMTKRASAVRAQESEARLLAAQKKDEAKEGLNVAQQAERQAATAVQEAEQLLRAATSHSAVASLAPQDAGGLAPAGGQAFASSTPPSSGFSALSTTSSSEAKNFHDMTFRAAAPQGFAPQPAVTQPLVAQPVAPQPVGVQPLAAPTIGTPPAPSVTGQVQTSLTAAQTRRFSAQVEAASAKADMSKALQASKEAHRAETAALAHVSAPGLDAAQKQAATAELALARSKHAEAASVVQAAKARAAKAYEEVILSEEAEGATVPQLADATKTRAATVYEGAIAQAGHVAHHGATGVQTALRREEAVAPPAPAVGGRQQIAQIMPAMSSTPFETRHTKAAREKVDKALAAATSKEEEVKRIEAWSAALIDAAKQKADEAMRRAREDVMKADEAAATNLVNFVKAKEREAATVAEQALLKQAEAAKMAQEAANARDEANKAAHKAAQWKADAQLAIKTTKEANLRTEHRPEPTRATALATVEPPAPSASKKGRKARAAAAATPASPTQKSDAAAKPKSKRKAGAKAASKKAANAAKLKKAAALASEDTEAWTQPSATDVKRDIVHRAWEAGGRAADGAPAPVGPAPESARVKAHTAWVAAHGDAPAAAAAPATVEDTAPPAEPMPEVLPHSGPAGHRVRLAWRAMRDTVLALNDARGVGQPGLEDAYTKQNDALALLTKVFPGMDDLPTARSPDLHTLFSQSKELGGLILVEEAKTLCAAALKELREQKTAIGTEPMTRLEQMQKGVHESLVAAEATARRRVEAVARKIAAEKQAVKAAVQAEALKKVQLAEEKDKGVLDQLRTDVRKKADNAVALRVRAIQAERVAEADRQEMEAATKAARAAQEEAEVESAKAVLDEAAAAANRRREEERKERRQNHEEDDLARLAARMSKDAAAYATAHKQPPAAAAVAPRPTVAAARKGGAGAKQVQRGGGARGAASAGGADAPPATAAVGKKAAPGANRQTGQQASAVAKKGAAPKQGGLSAGKLAGVAAGKLAGVATGKETFAARRRQQLVALEAPKGAKRERKLAAKEDESARPQKANRARE